MNEYKRVPFEHLHNCRDLGGYARADGKMIAYHRLYRSETLDRLTEREWERLKAMGVKTCFVSLYGGKRPDRRAVCYDIFAMRRR